MCGPLEACEKTDAVPGLNLRSSCLQWPTRRRSSVVELGIHKPSVAGSNPAVGIASTACFIGVFHSRASMRGWSFAPNPTRFARRYGGLCSPTDPYIDFVGPVIVAGGKVLALVDRLLLVGRYAFVGAFAPFPVSSSRGKAPQKAGQKPGVHDVKTARNPAIPVTRGPGEPFRGGARGLGAGGEAPKRVRNRPTKYPEGP